ncbi:MAG: mechanosensitive ion channel domain-containing protein [Chitinophagaceae bacterium]
MRSFLQQVFFDNTVRDYLVLVVAILLILLFKRYLSRYIATTFFRLLHKASWNIGKEEFVNLLRGPIHVFLVLSVVFFMLDKMNFPSFLQFKIHRIPFQDIVESSGKAIIIVTFIWLLLRLIDFVALTLQQKADIAQGISANQLVVFFKDFLKVILVFIGILLLIRFTLNKDIAPLLAGFGIVGAALALSARESLENLIASFIIFFDKPFFPGDLVKVQQITGTVERIGLRSTRIRTDQKTYVTVPNKQMVDSILDNLTLRTQRRGFLSLEISGATPYELVQQLIAGIRKILQQQNENVQTSSVVLSDITRNSFVIQVEYFTGDIAMEAFNNIREEMNLSIIQLMEESKVKLAGREQEMVVAQA